MLADCLYGVQVTMSKKVEPEELDPLRAAARAQDVNVKEAQAEAAAQNQQQQHQAERARWKVSAILPSQLCTHIA